MALQETFCNHYRRAASNVNIFNFFNYRIGIDGRNDQTGALGIPGIAFGAVSGKWGCVCKMPRSGRIWSILAVRAAPRRLMVPHYHHASLAHNHTCVAHGAAHGHCAHPHGSLECVGARRGAFLGRFPRRFSRVSTILEPQIRRNSPKRGPESLPRGAMGALAPTWATPTHMGARVG